MPRTIALAQDLFSNMKSVFFILFCLILALTVIYVLQTGDIIQKVFLLGAYKSKTENNFSINSINNHSANVKQDGQPLALIEKQAAGLNFVPVDQVQYIPLTSELWPIAHLASNIQE